MDFTALYVFLGYLGFVFSFGMLIFLFKKEKKIKPIEVKPTCQFYAVEDKESKALFLMQSGR